MSLISLTTTEMVNLSSTWIDPTHADHLALIAYPALATFMTQIEHAHHGVLDLQGGGEEVRVSSIAEQQSELNVTHDDFARAIHYNLRSQALLAPNEVEAQQFLDLDALLFPEGLNVINLGHVEIAAHAQLLATCLRPEHEAALAAIPTRFGNLLEHVRAWMAVARELGKLAQARGQGSQSRRLTPGRARMAWVRMVNTLRTLIQTLNIDDSVIDDIMTRIEVAIRVAGRRTPANAATPEPACEPQGHGDEPAFSSSFAFEDTAVFPAYDEEKTLPGVGFPANDADDDDDGDPAATAPTRQLIVQPGSLPRVLPVPLTALRHRR